MCQDFFFAVLESTEAEVALDHAQARSLWVMGWGTCRLNGAFAPFCLHQEAPHWFCRMLLECAPFIGLEALLCLQFLKSSVLLGLPAFGDGEKGEGEKLASASPCLV